MNTNSAYAALKAAASERGLPRSHAADLTEHDKRWCEAHPGRPFAWLVYASGTHLVFPRTPSEVEIRRRKRHRIYAAAELALMVHDGFADDESAWFWWDGSALRAVESLGTVEDLLDEAEHRLAGRAA